MAQTAQIPETLLLGPDMTEEEFRNWLKQHNIAENAIKIIIEDQKLTVADLLNEASWPDAGLAQMHTLLNIPIGYTAKLQGAIKMTKMVLRENKRKDPVGKIIRAIKESNFSTEDIKEIVNAIQQDDECPIIEHPFDSKFSFPVICGIIPPSPWCQLEHAPFFNRQQAILRLLMDCYSSYFYQFDSNNKVYDANVPSKPVAALLGTAPGYGKTRLLLEWAIRAFHDKDVLHTFLTKNCANNTTGQHMDVVIETFAGEWFELADKFQTPGKTDNESKARFLCTLHQTLQKSAVISASMANISINTNQQMETIIDEVCRKILAWGICAHFKFKNVSPPGKSQSIAFPRGFDVSQNEDYEFLKDNGLLLKFGEHSTFFSMFQLFVDLMEDKKIDTIGQTGDYPLFLINVDEAQALVDIKAYERTLAYEVIKRFYEVPTLMHAGVFVFMTGLVTKSLDLLSDPTRLLVDVSLPLNPLLQPEYCTKALQIYDKKFTTDQKFSDDGKALIKLLWNRCLGIPRALQLLHGVILQYSELLELKKITDYQRKTVLRDFYKSAKDYFGERGAVDYTTFGVDKTKWERFTTECCLGIAKRPTDKFSEKMTYSDLERKGTIFPIEFYEVEEEGQYRRYTMPFLFFSSLLKKEITYLEAFKELEKVTIIPTIGDIVGNDGSKSIQEQGSSLERACATSLWACYKLTAKEGELIKLQKLVPSWPKNDHYVCFSGVGEANEPIGSTTIMSCFNEEVKESTAVKNQSSILKSQLIIINKANTQFADVLVPIVQLKDSEYQNITWEEIVQKTKFLLIQCCNVQRNSASVKPFHIADNLVEHKILDLLTNGHFFVLMSPNNGYPEALWQRAKNPAKATILKDHKDNIIETTGQDWLSELFLLVNKNAVLEQDNSAIKKFANTAAPNNNNVNANLVAPNSVDTDPAVPIDQSKKGKKRKREGEKKEAEQRKGSKKAKK